MRQKPGAAQDGRAVAGADVKARIADCDCKKDCPGVVGCPCCPDAVTKTDSRGDYNLILKPGEYDVRIFRDGIEKTSHDVKVDKGKTREYDAKVKENY